MAIKILHNLFSLFLFYLEVRRVLALNTSIVFIVSCALFLAPYGLGAGAAKADLLKAEQNTQENIRDAIEVTVQIDPSYQHPVFEGWGTSLVWMANTTGGYPDEIRNALVDMVFGEEGLNLNIARYNIGGGNAPDVRKDYMKVGATMEGFWRAPPGITQQDMDWWNPENPEHWNWQADANQRWWIDQIKHKITHWEAFSNSPPWFQTVSGYVSGGFNSSEDQIRLDRVDGFATYLVKVSEFIEDAHNIEFATIDPLNEPNTPYWGTQLGDDGQPTGGRQEGAHAGPALQQAVILALENTLRGAETQAVISAMDETNPGTFRNNWNAYNSEAKEAVAQLNVHTYGTSSRTSVRDIAKGENKTLWMSEVEGSFHSPTDYNTMATGLGIAQRMVNDLRELEPSAWVFWQPIEDTIPQVNSNNNWGSIHVPFNCEPNATLDTCPIQTNTKFNTIRQFTHYIRPGDRMVKVNNSDTIAAIGKERKAKVVHVNSDVLPHAVTLDLSLFAKVSRRASVTPVTSSEGKALVKGEPITVMNKTASIIVPPRSVTTLLINGVTGVAPEAPFFKEDHIYRLNSVSSGLSLIASKDTNCVDVDDQDDASLEQLWKIKPLTGGYSNRERYALFSVANGKMLQVLDNFAQLVTAPEDLQAIDTSAQWMMSTTGGGSWTLVNVASTRLLDLWGQGPAEGCRVNTWLANSGSNQRWQIIDEIATSTLVVETYTLPGIAPTLPDVVTAVYRNGPGRSLAAEWAQVKARTWSKPGLKRVKGIARDILGREIPAEAKVWVDNFNASKPTRAKTFVGGQAELPSQVMALGENGGRAILPVTWQAIPDDALHRAGVYTVEGSASLLDGSVVPAAVRVQVTEPVDANIANENGVNISATFTEGGYSTAGLRNGDLLDKAWSNWKPGDTKNPSDTITINLPEAKFLSRVVTYFYQDGSNQSSAETLQIQLQGDDDRWFDASPALAVADKNAPIVDVELVDANGGNVSEAINVVMNARPGGYMTVSEIEVYSNAPGLSQDASLQAIWVDGQPIAGFSPENFDYEVVDNGKGRGKVTAISSGPYAEVEIYSHKERKKKRVSIVVSSEDGSRQLTYEVLLTRKKPRDR